MNHQAHCGMYGALAQDGTMQCTCGADRAGVAESGHTRTYHPSGDGGTDDAALAPFRKWEGPCPKCTSHNVRARYHRANIQVGLHRMYSVPESLSWMCECGYECLTVRPYTEAHR